MKSFNFSALKLMTSLCLLLFVSLAATRLQAQEAKHTTTFALWEVENGNQGFALWNKYSKQYLYFDDVQRDAHKKVEMRSQTTFPHTMEKLSGGAYQVEFGTDLQPSLMCCKGSNNDAFWAIGTSSQDDLLFEEVSKDLFRIKFRHNGTYLTVGGSTNNEIYGTTIKMGDHQLWMITGR